jgi:hypothetical protein
MYMKSAALIATLLALVLFGQKRSQSFTEKTTAIRLSMVGGGKRSGTEIASTPSHGGVSISGVNPNDTFPQIIGVLDAFLSAGSGFSVLTDHISELLKAETDGKAQ